jgi:hypothetical protein
MYAARGVVRRTPRRVVGTSLSMRQAQPCRLVHHVGILDGMCACLGDRRH